MKYLATTDLETCSSDWAKLTFTNFTFPSIQKSLKNTSVCWTTIKEKKTERY
jgi:hypothetical protein